MRIECPECKTGYNVDGSKIPPKGAHIRCKKCQARFFISREEPAQTPAEEQAPEQTEVPDVPDVPDVPEVPDAPSIPDPPDKAAETAPADEPAEPASSPGDLETEKMQQEAVGLKTPSKPGVPGSSPGGRVGERKTLSPSPAAGSFFLPVTES